MAKDRDGKQDTRVYAPSHRRPRYESVHRLEPMGRDALKDAALRQLGRGNPAPESEPEERPDKPPRQEGKRQKKAKVPRRQATARRIVGWLIALVAVIGLGLAGWFVFLIEQVEIEGNDRYSEESIRSLTGVSPGEHMLLCDFGEIRRGVEESPYLKVEKIERIWPRTIKVTVEERTEAAVIETLEADVIIDITGHVLSFGSGSDLSHLIRVVGVSLTGYQVNQPIAGNVDFQSQSLFSLLSGLADHGLLEDVALADISNPLRAWLMTRSGVRVVLGQPTELEEKLSWMRDALQSLELSGVTEGTLDVSAKGGAVWSPAVQTPAEPVPAEPAEPGPDDPDAGEPAEPGDPDNPDDPAEPDEPAEPADPDDSGGDGDDPGE